MPTIAGSAQNGDSAGAASSPPSRRGAGAIRATAAASRTSQTTAARAKSTTETAAGVPWRSAIARQTAATPQIPNGIEKKFGGASTRRDGIPGTPTTTPPQPANVSPANGHERLGAGGADRWAD